MSASLATCTRAPVALPSRAASGTLRQPGRLGGLTSTPFLMSIGPGAAIVMLVTFSRRRWPSISSAAHSTMRSGVRSSGVLVLKLAINRPSERASATRTWVPPRSIPASIAVRLSGQQLLAAERGQDLHRRAGAVEGVEVQAGHAGLEQLDALLDAVTHSQRPHGVVVRSLLDRASEVRGERGAGHGRHECERAPAGHWHEPGHDRDGDAGPLRSTHEVEVEPVVEEELRYEEVRARVDLQLHVAKLMCLVGALRMLLGAARGPDAEAISRPPQERDEVAAVLEVRIGRHERLAGTRRVATQREDVRDPLALHPVEDRARFVGGVRTREVRHRLDVVLALDACDELERLLPGRLAIRDRNPVRRVAGKRGGGSLA